MAMHNAWFLDFHLDLLNSTRNGLNLSRVDPDHVSSHYELQRNREYLIREFWIFLASAFLLLVLVILWVILILSCKLLISICRQRNSTLRPDPTQAMVVNDYIGYNHPEISLQRYENVRQMKRELCQDEIAGIPPPGYDEVIAMPNMQISSTIANFAYALDRQQDEGDYSNPPIYDACMDV